MSEYREIDNAKREGPEKIDLIGLMIDVRQAVKKLWWLVIVLTAALAAGSYFSVSTSYHPQYVASATLAVSSSGSSAYVDVQSAQQMAELFPYIMTSGVLREVVAEDMGLESLPGTISASAEAGTSFLTLSVTSNDPQMAYDILTTVIEDYPQVAEFVLGQTTLTLLDETGVPEDTGREVVIRGSFLRGGMKGAMLGCLIIALYVLTRRTVKSRKALHKALNLDDLGALPHVPEKKRRKKKSYSNVNLMNERVPQGYLEAVRKIRIKVMTEMEQNKYQTILVTSSIPGEGKTTLAVNLAIAIARQGKRVVLVDCDMRNPSVAAQMNDSKKRPGLKAVLQNKVRLEDALKPVEVGGGSLEILYSSRSAAKDSALLSGKEMRQLIGVLKQYADIVILDTAPSGLLADAPAMAKFVDAAVYVVKYDYVKLRQIRDGISALAISGVNILGYVFSDDKTSRSRGYGYGYGYKQYGSYGHYGHYGRSKDIGKKADKSGRIIKE